jgi:hypothetical protein
MPANRRRKTRVSNRIPMIFSAEYLGGLCADAFLSEGGNSSYPDKLTSEEHNLVCEYEHCGRDFQKWLKYRERKIERAKARKLKSKKLC